MVALPRAFASGPASKLMNSMRLPCFSPARSQVPTARPRWASYRSPSVTRCAAKMESSAKFFVGGNWKCNGSTASINKLVEDLNSGSVPTDIDIVCSPPFVYLSQVKASLKAPYQIAAQNCWVGKGGAFTGEVSAEMLRDSGIPWVILGHSERRSLCGESNEFVGDKVAYAQEQGLSVIACIGETLAQRESGDMFDVLDAQMSAITEKVKDWSTVVVAYEPVWAIGTGVVATPAQAQEVHEFLRKWVVEKVSPEVSQSLRIIYGGSVNNKNCVELAGQPDIDGFLVGGASLQGEAFVEICNANKKAVAA